MAVRATVIISWAFSVCPELCQVPATLESQVLCVGIVIVPIFQMRVEKLGKWLHLGGTMLLKTYLKFQSWVLGFYLLQCLWEMPVWEAFLFFNFFFFKSSPHLAWDYMVSVDEGIRCHFNHLGHRNPTQFTFSIPENNLLFQSSLWFVLEGKNLSTNG